MEGPHLNFERCAFSPLTFGTPSSSDTCATGSEPGLLHRLEPSDRGQGYEKWIV